ncbi:MAG: hypothetical protein R6W81_01765 [Bacteroidales bacterium]
MYKTISLFVSLILIIECGSVQKHEKDGNSGQVGEKAASAELKQQYGISVSRAIKDSCWFFLSEKEGRFFIDESEDVPLMRICIEKGKGQLKVSYGQEGFLFYLVDTKTDDDITEYYCLNNPEGTDTLLVKAEILSSGVVVWTIPNPFTREEDFETIFTVPECEMSYYLIRIDSSGVDDTESEKNN